MSHGHGSSKPAGALRLPLPDGWEIEQHVTIRLPRPTGDDIAFQPNIIVAIRPMAPEGSVASVASDRARELEQLPQFERGLTLSGELFGQPAARIGYRWHDGRHTLRQVLILGALEGRLYEITFSDVASRFDRTVVELDAWLAALTWATRDRPPAAPAGHRLELLWPGRPR